MVGKGLFRGTDSKFLAETMRSVTDRKSSARTPLLQLKEMKRFVIGGNTETALDGRGGQDVAATEQLPLDRWPQRCFCLKG